MKKMTKIALLIILSGAGSVAAAEDVTISDATCTITGGDAQSESASPYFTVHLPSISTTALATDGHRTGDTPFHISLSGANCTNGKVASVFFELAQITNINSTVPPHF